MMTVHEASQKWLMDERRITSLCREGKILGAKKEGKYWMIPDNIPRPVDGRFKVDISVEQNITTTKYTQQGAYENVVNAFEKKYNRRPVNVSFTPYRICLVGAHSDHQLGKITGYAIDKGIYIAYGPKRNGML